MRGFGSGLGLTLQLGNLAPRRVRVRVRVEEAWLSDGCQMDIGWVSDMVRVRVEDAWVSDGCQMGIGWMSDGVRVRVEEAAQG